MIEADLFAIIDPVLRAAGAVPDEGEEYREPPLDVLRYHRRPVRLSRVPWFGRALSVVAVVRQPLDIVGVTTPGLRQLLTRLAMAVNSRYPPWLAPRAAVIGLTTLVLTSEPIAPGDDALLGTGLTRLPRLRVVPFGLIRVNLGQEALAMALTSDPDRLFPESAAMADALIPHLGRFVPFLDPS
jgi:hypothetical protein